jgi:pyrroline-5-carboxylate reductase
MKKGPIIICPKDNQIKKFFNNLGTVIEVKNENLSKGFWSTSSFMASFYNLQYETSSWLVSKGIKKDKAEKYTKELFLALSADAVNKNKTSLKQLVLESQTPGGTNAYVLQELKKKKFYKLQQKVLNSIFKKF